MSSKINFFKIISGHLWTLKDSSTDKISLWDLFLFIAFPILLSIFSGWKTFIIPDDVVSNLLNIGVLLSALLLNLLVIVYTLKEKLPKVDSNIDGWEKLQLKHNAIKELYYNISASVLTAFFVLVLSVTHNLLISFTNITIKSITIPSLNGNIFDPILIFFTINLALTFLMIIKRTYLLLITDT
jgi:hypothetical protein